MLRFLSPTAGDDGRKQSESESMHSVRSSGHSAGDSTNYFSANSEDAYEFTDVSDNSSLGSAPPVLNAWSIQTGIGPENGQVLDLASLATPVASNQSPEKLESRAEGQARVIIRSFDEDEFHEGSLMPRLPSWNSSFAALTRMNSTKEVWASDL